MCLRPLQSLASSVGLPTSKQLAAPIVRVAVFCFFHNSNTCPLGAGRRPRNSCQMVTVVFIGPTHRSASWRRVPTVIQPDIWPRTVRLPLSARPPGSICGKQERFGNGCLPHFCPQSCSRNFWPPVLCQCDHQTKSGKSSQTFHPHLCFCYAPPRTQPRQTQWNRRSRSPRAQSHLQRVI